MTSPAKRAPTGTSNPCGEDQLGPAGIMQRGLFLILRRGALEFQDRGFAGDEGEAYFQKAAASKERYQSSGGLEFVQLKGDSP